ncbi:hypothetical protein P775_15075 [Puniceibacterium antarcticum]|uniref:Fumarylacetoacetase-like C-terminal domain-containing protein n=1 Tax=Puniceibacterium antarcticum TaxID=1206336 RepID=A0A2G8RD26_9RHOB|nr:fumarylacetoacetate hydrolase family protein [Puniceibacterium antarcticum]PIL19459.1 hypothetical protein P775_15075 [Puniceibacterium antarcticum]
MSFVQFDPQAAGHILLASWNGAPRPEGLTPTVPDTTAAYAVQEAVLQGLGDPGGVWKLALLGGTTRETAVLPRRALHISGTSLTLPSDTAIEVETALVLAGDPADSTPIDAIAEVRLAFELIAPRFAPGAAVSPLDKMADGFSSAAIVLGDVLADWRAGLPDQLGIVLSLEGVPVLAPETAAPLDEALDFLDWLSRHARAQGRPLRRGDVVITGARIGPLPLNGAQHVQACVMGATVTLG